MKEVCSANLYDSDGNEVKLPEGCNLVRGKAGASAVKNNGYVVNFVYRSPNYPGPIAMDAKLAKTREICG